MTETPSSPFDDIMPWAGMQIIEDEQAGTFVSIPKFYYKLAYNTEGATNTSNGGMSIQISMKQYEGFEVSPAHMNRAMARVSVILKDCGIMCMNGVSGNFNSSDGRWLFINNPAQFMV